MIFYKQYPFVILSILLFTGCAIKSRDSSDDPNEMDSIEWKILGPGGGGGVLKPTISPFDENFLMYHCDMSGAYITYDGGVNWKMKNLWNVPEDFEFDPCNENTVYVATKGFLHSEDRGSGISLLLKSENKGEKWRIIFPDVSKSKEVERLQSMHILPSEIIDGALNGTIQKVRVDPNDNKRIYLGLTPLIDYMTRGNKTEDIDSTKLVLSTNQGSTWRTIALLPGKKVLAIFPESSDDLITVFTENSCLKINEITGKIYYLPLPVNHINSVEGGKSGDEILIYLQSDMINEKGKLRGGMFVSRDMGATWEQINNGLMKYTAAGRVPSFRRGMAVCGTKSEVVYLSIIDPIINANRQAEEVYGIYKTINAGRNWEPVLLSSIKGGYITKNFKGSWLEDSFDPGWGGSPIDLGVAPGNPDVCYAGDNGRGYKTINGGKTWEQVYSHNNADKSFSNNGINVTTCYGVHYDPFDKNHYFICYTDIGLFHTFNGGESWYHSITKIPREWQNTCYEVVFDPEVKGKVWSVWANAHDLPRAKMFDRHGFDRYEGGVAVSIDGGRSWNKSNKGIPENSVCTGILLDTSTPVESRNLYVSVFGKGIYKSTDSGKTWKVSNHGFGKNLFAWQLRKNAKGRLFAVFSRGEADGKVVDGTIYYSDDNAATWEQVLLPEGVNGVHDLLIDPVHSEIMYVSCWPRSLNGKDSHGGVIKTEDGGRTWKQVFDEKVRVNAGGIDPGQPNVVYINTFQNAAYRSENYGETWKRIEGYSFKWGQRAIPDIHNPGMIFLTTYGGSVFYGPANGIRGASNDIENMPEGWW